MKNITLNEIKQGRLLSIISYIGPISLITLIISNNKYVMFHSKQSLRLFIIYIIPLIILKKLEQNNIMWELTDKLLALIILFIIFISLIGINNALSGKIKELPIINKIFKRNKVRK